jgi:ribose transport system ATP-binding protein
MAASDNSLRLPVLEASGITLRFPGVVALNDVHFRIYPGCVNALIGENGAGKSSLMNILSGVYTNYEGTLYLEGQPIVFRNVAEAQRAGIVMIHQELNLIPNMTVAENIFLGREPIRTSGLIDRRRMVNEASRLLQRLNVAVPSEALVEELRVGQQQLVEIAKALSQRASVLIMDEPTSSLSENETQTLFALIRSLTAEGVGIVYITHKMDEIRQLADYVTVLRDGHLILESPAPLLTLDEMVHAMVGRRMSEFFVKHAHPKGAVSLAVSHLELEDASRPGHLLLRDISFQVAASEVVGIYGLMGSGRTALLESLFGLNGGRARGDVTVKGKPVSLKQPREAIQEGLSLIPEDRQREGLVLSLSVAENCTLASLEKIIRYGMLDLSKEHEWANFFQKQLNIKAYSTRQLVGQLSGGNQQKVVLAKWLMTHPCVLLLDEPTRGIDLNAKNEIYRLMDQCAEKGMAIVLVSSELPEIMAVSDRILTICQGVLTGSYERAEFSEETILKTALPGFSGS